MIHKIKGYIEKSSGKKFPEKCFDPEFSFKKLDFSTDSLNTVFEPDRVVCLEAPLYVAGLGGFQIEDAKTKF
jgi:Xaa-Pro aminopeptidase